MFQQEDVKKYQEIKAPVRLKENILSSVKMARRTVLKQRIAYAAMATVVVLLILVGRAWDNNITNNNIIVSVDDTVVSYSSLKLEKSYSKIQTANTGIGRDNVLQIQVPLKITANNGVRMVVNSGTLQLEETKNALSEKVTELTIPESEIVYWTVTVKEDILPTCTIISDKYEYMYIIEYNEEDNIYTIRQKK